MPRAREARRSWAQKDIRLSMTAARAAPARGGSQREPEASSANYGFPTVHRAGATPVPIPNTEVKPCFGDGTAGFPGGRVARRWDLSEAALVR